MSDQKQQFNLLHTREYESGGEKRTFYTKIGRAWEITGGFALEIDPGMALYGRAVILPRKADDPQG